MPSSGIRLIRGMSRSSPWCTPGDAILTASRPALDHILDEKACPVAEAFDGIEVAEQHHNHVLLEFELVRRQPGRLVRVEQLGRD